MTIARQNTLWDDSIDAAGTGGGFATLLGLVCRRIGETLETSSVRGLGGDHHTMVFVSSQGLPIVLTPMGFMQVAYETLATRYTEMFTTMGDDSKGSNNKGGIRATASAPTMRLCYLELCQLSWNGRKIAGNF